MTSQQEQTRQELLVYQRNEITENLVYKRLAAIEKNKENSQILLEIAAEEQGHYEVLKRITGESPAPHRWKVFKYYWLARILGVTFAMKLMESGEENAHRNYEAYREYPELLTMAQDEEKHEMKLLSLINEEKLSYMGSVVLGLNDALVEFTGALAGFTLALGSNNLIALTGLITGIAAALSMASSEYLSTKSDGDKEKRPVKAAIYTGIAYIITVFALVSPFMFMKSALAALGIMLAAALIIIALFNYYYAVAKSESFKKRFVEMALLSFSVAGVSFVIGYLLRRFTGMDA